MKEKNEVDKKKLNEEDILKYLQTVMDNKFAHYIMKEMAETKKIEKSLAIYAGVEKPSGVRESLRAKTVSVAIERAAKMFNAEPEDIKSFLKDPYMRKGFSVIIRGIAEYGISKPQRLSAPFMVVWNFTKQCNLKCKHCYANAKPYPAPDELTLEQKMEVLRQLDEAGVAAISFSGGEPLINRDFWLVAKKASELGFYVSVATNGTLITEEVAKRLKQIGVRYVEISIDGPTAEIHDEFRGVKGAFDRSINAIKNLKKVGGIDVGIATVATHHNLDTMPDMIRLGRGLDVDRMIFFNFIPTGRGKDIAKGDLSPEEREKLMKYLYSEWQKGDMQIFSTCPAYARISLTAVAEEKGHKLSPTHFADIELPEEYMNAGQTLAEFIGGCGAGRIYCSIEHNGDVQPCVFMPIKVGNVITNGFQQVWDTSDIFLKLRDRDAAEYACSTCPFRYICGGCRARAYSYFGDIQGPDPGCIIQKDKWDEVTEKEDEDIHNAGTGESGKNHALS